ncbi:hypothetical protein BB8028_0003g04610 [Beauveria bassiana]|uniref:Tetraspanin Tsp3 n=1 Tax=Beauveria bassiana TaxID=176275 RepID=A0A2S7Y713_BEABA|nr:hypothetical protein BB8028_0003g04610 [Beauveria bassiana]
MTKFFVAYILSMLLLIGVAIYQHISSAKLSLPISGLTISTVLLLLFALIDSTFYYRWAKETRAYRAIGRGVWLSQGVATIILATLFFSYIPSSDARDCLLSTVWQRIFSSHDAQTIRRIQDAFNCCGFNTVRDRAWPFPTHETARSCEEMYGRTIACNRPFRATLQRASGVEFGVLMISGLVKILYLLLEDYYASATSAATAANRIGFGNTARAPLLPRAYEESGRSSEEDDVANQTTNRENTGIQERSPWGP